MDRRGDGTTPCGLFEAFARRVRQSGGHRKVDDDSSDPAARHARHVFLAPRACAVEAPALPLGRPRPRRQHAAGKRSREPVVRAARLAFSLVLAVLVVLDGRARRSMARLGLQPPTGGQQRFNYDG